jgi:hypothetical protein
MNNDEMQKSDKSFTIEDLRRALDDAQLREDIRSHYEVAAPDSDVADESSFEDQSERRKEAIFNSW